MLLEFYNTYMADMTCKQPSWNMASVGDIVSTV